MILIDNFIVDASLRETHTLESEVTEYPIESGATIADNVRPKPISVEIDYIVTDTPLPGPVADARGPTDANGNFEHAPTDDALAHLEAIYNTREPITITTSLKTYENMVMENLAIERDPETGHSLTFTAAFRQVLLVTNNRATIKVAPPQQTVLGPKKDLGNKITYDLKKGALLWIHSTPLPAWSTREVLGYKADEGGSTNHGLYHDPAHGGQPLTQDELIQMYHDHAAFASTHDTQGNPTNQLLPFVDQFGINGVSDRGGSVHNTEAIYQDKDGQWHDALGDPVVYNPNYGNWIEKMPF